MVIDVGRHPARENISNELMLQNAEIAVIIAGQKYKEDCLVEWKQ